MIFQQNGELGSCCIYYRSILVKLIPKKHSNKHSLLLYTALVAYITFKQNYLCAYLPLSEGAQPCELRAVTEKGPNIY